MRERERERIVDMNERNDVERVMRMYEHVIIQLTEATLEFMEDFLLSFTRCLPLPREKDNCKSRYHIWCNWSSWKLRGQL